MAKAKTRTKTAPKAKGKVASATSSKTVDRKAADADLLSRAQALREDGLTIAAIADKLKVTTNKLTILFLTADVRPKDRIKGTDKEIAAAIVEGRDKQKQSWPQLMARTGFSQSKVKSIYEAKTGRSANQGYSVVSSRNPDKPAPKAKPKAKAKAAPAKASAKPKVKAKTKTKKRKAAANPS